MFLLLTSVDIEERDYSSHVTNHTNEKHKRKHPRVVRLEQFQGQKEKAATVRRSNPVHTDA